jgi:NitT/TauT family transport system permease protein
VSEVAIPKRPRAVGWSRLPGWLRYVILLAALLAVWQLYVKWRDVNPLLFSTVDETASQFWDGWRDGTLANATWQTIRLLLMGVGIGVGIAAVLTTFATLTTVGRDLLTLLTAMFYPLPGVAMLPMALLWFGINAKAIVFVVAMAAIWPVAINLTTAFKTANPTIVAVGRNIGLSKLRVVTDVLAPSALPHAISGLKIAWAFGWRTVVAAELVFGVVGGSGGHGTYINDAKLNLFIPKVFAALVSIVMVGVAIELLFTVIERRTVVRWGMQRS